jgi:predicted HD superfamily hydrolase involved in NAD metabolism
MQHLWQQLLGEIEWTGDARIDMCALLAQHRYQATAEHCLQVAAEASRLAARFGVPEAKAQIAGWLHDISVVMPSPSRPEIARRLGLDVLPEEETVPMILHQKISAAMACQVFGIDDPCVLDAIGCHTTLKADASLLAKVLFLADKIAWDQQGVPPYLELVQAALERSLDDAVYQYLDHLWRMRDALPVVHPWLVDAHRQLEEQIRSSAQLTSGRSCV